MKSFEDLRVFLGHLCAVIATNTVAFARRHESASVCLVYSDQATTTQDDVTKGILFGWLHFSSRVNFTLSLRRTGCIIIVNSLTGLTLGV
jgi:hypothetical protein